MDVKLPLGKGLYAILDEPDYYKVMYMIFYALKGRNTTYAVHRKDILLHRFLMGLQKGDPRQVDHEDGDGLNNRRNNLRICTPQQNSRNHQGKRDNQKYKGIYVERDKYAASIWNGTKQIYLGSFLSMQDAARAYDAKAREVFGEFAWLNFPEVKL